MVGLIMFAFTCGRVQRALRSGNRDGAGRLLENHVRRWPKGLEGWSLYYRTLVLSEAPFDRRLAISRRAFDQLPYRMEMFDHVTSNLAHAYVITGDIRFLKELRMCVGRYEKLLGETPESLIVRSELAQLEGDDVVALGLANLAHQRLEGVRPATMLMKLGACYASIPGKEELGHELLEEAGRSGQNAASYLVLAVIVETRDPARAQACVAQARSMLPPERMSSERFERLLAGLRETHQAELRIRRGTTVPPPPPPSLWAGMPGAASPR
ncbi:MAG: hypothetical protein M3391_10790 [Actinomycetota bacterium]|nr:hypothetical protein [Actinomycetota bacterium]